VNEPVRSDLSGKTCLVTGASAGVGLAAARALAGLGARVIMAVRTERKRISPDGVELVWATNALGYYLVTELLAASPEVEGASGLFWMSRQERPCRFRGEAGEDALWSPCREMTSRG
jgi:NAD(P)-dependent dehydrogenase (short-subunit alcohol dehydrogenase family)